MMGHAQRRSLRTHKNQRIACVLSPFGGQLYKKPGFPVFSRKLTEADRAKIERVDRPVQIREIDFRGTLLAKDDSHLLEIEGSDRDACDARVPGDASKHGKEYGSLLRRDGDPIHLLGADIQ